MAELNKVWWRDAHTTQLGSRQQWTREEFIEMEKQDNEDFRIYTDGSGND